MEISWALMSQIRQALCPLCLSGLLFRGQQAYVMTAVAPGGNYDPVA